MEDLVMVTEKMMMVTQIVKDHGNCNDEGNSKDDSNDKFNDQYI